MRPGIKDNAKGNREGACSLVKEGWYTSNYDKENDDLPLRKKKVYI